MSVSKEKLQHLAMLSDFDLPEDGTEELGRDINQIVQYISQLDEIDTEGVEPTYQVFEMQNVWREDKILPQDADREKLLKTAPDMQDNQIKVPKVL